MKKMSNAEKQARTVAPSVPASQRRAVIGQATSRTKTKSAVTGRYTTKVTPMGATKKSRRHPVA